MKKIVCELCEGTSFVKEGGMFICQGCGTSYSAAEAKNMMREVEGDAPVAAPVAMPQVNPNQQQLDNILVLATSAYEADNKKEAESYCNRAIEIDAMCYKAWFLKGKAVGWQSKIDDLRIEEAAHSFCKAIDFAPEEEKESLKDQAVEELKRLGLALISLRKQRFSGSPDEEELKGFTTGRKVLLDSLMVLLRHGNAVGMPDGYLDEIATMMNEAAVAAYRMATAAWAKVDYPTDKDLSTYIDWMSNIESLLKEAIDASDDDEEKDIVRYENLILVLEDPIGKCSYKREWSSYRSEYIHVRSKSLTDAACNFRREQKREYEKKIAAIKKRVADKKAAEERKAAEEKKARIKAYWEAHADEKAALDAEKAELEAKIKKLRDEIVVLDKKVYTIEKEAEQPVPSEAEMAGVKDQIKELESRRAGLGLFAGKEKKQLAEQIASLQGRVDSLQNRIKEEKDALKAEADKKAAPVKGEKKKLVREREAAEKRVKAIDAILTKDPEE